MRNKNLKNHSIYKIENTKTCQRYIGRTNNLENRKHKHFSKLKKNKHHSPHLQNAYNKYGEKVFQMIVLCSGLTKDEAVELEQLILDECFDDLYNCSRSATTPMGSGDKHTAEAKKKMSEARLGKFKGENHPRYGKQHTEESKKKISEARLGKFKGENHPRSKPFSVIFPDGHIEQWKTTTEAAEAYGVSRGSIGRYINGKRIPGNNPSSAHLKDTIWQYV